MANKLYVSALVVLAGLSGVAILLCIILWLRWFRPGLAERQASMAHKLYLSALIVLVGLGGMAVLATIIVAAHDATKYHALPEDDRHAIERLNTASGWWLVHTESRKKGEARLKLERAVPLWGSAIHREAPLLAVLLSLVAFVPAILFMGITKWVRWLRSGSPAAVMGRSDASSTEYGWVVGRNTAVAVVGGVACLAVLLCQGSAVVVVGAVVCFTVLLLGFFIWPTPYQYTRVRDGSGEKLYRINRITGKAEEVQLR